MKGNTLPCSHGCCGVVLGGGKKLENTSFFRARSKEADNRHRKDIYISDKTRLRFIQKKPGGGHSVVLREGRVQRFHNVLFGVVWIAGVSRKHPTCSWLMVIGRGLGCLLLASGSGREEVFFYI